MDNNVYYLALSANFCFALGIMVFTHYSSKISPAFMNYVKCFIATICFAITITLTTGWHAIQIDHLLIFIISGGVALGIGDLFLLKSFSILGPARAMTLFGVQPIFIGILSYFFLGQELDTHKMWGIFFFILCLITFSIENFRKNKSWGVLGISVALIGVLLDGVGIVMTRIAFDLTPQISTFEGVLYRCIGSVLFLTVLSFFKPLKIQTNFMAQSNKGRGALIIGSILGTYLSLTLYLMAVRVGHLAGLSAVAITGPLFTSILECCMNKKLPSKYFVLAFVFFLFGTSFVIDFWELK